MSERFIVGKRLAQVGIIDTQKGMFAPFYGEHEEYLAWRLNKTVAELNSGKQTPTGYVWDKLPVSQAGTGGDRGA